MRLISRESMAKYTLDKKSLKKPYNSDRSSALITNLKKLKHLKAIILSRLKCDFKFTVFKFTKLRLGIAVKELVDNESACINGLIITLRL